MASDYNIISNVSERVLRSLARHKFLTVSMMLRSGVGTSSVSYLRKQLKTLKNDRKRPLIGVIEYAPTGPKKGGRYEYFYYLKNAGKKLLMEQLGFQEEEIKIPSGYPQFHSLYHHRRMQIEFQIALWAYVEQANAQVVWYDNDFDMIGSNRGNGQKLEAKTKITIGKKEGKEIYIIPDGVFLLDTPKGEKFILIEFHRGGDVKRIIDQLYLHGLAISRALPSLKYQIDKGNRVLVVFEREVTMRSAMKKLAANTVFSKLENHFLFKTQKQVDESIGEPWRKFTGGQTPLF